jgi:hypothetical protein
LGKWKTDKRAQLTSSNDSGYQVVAHSSPVALKVRYLADPMNYCDHTYTHPILLYRLATFGCNGRMSRVQFSMYAAAPLCRNLTVSANAGIGRAIVEEIAMLGGKVLTCARDEAALHAAQASWDEKRFQVRSIKADVTDAQDAEKLVSEACTYFDGTASRSNHRVASALARASVIGVHHLRRRKFCNRTALTMKIFVH